MNEQDKRILNEFKIFTNGTVENIDKISLVLAILKRKVLNYCCREDIPEGLELVLVEMLSDYNKALVSQKNEDAGQSSGEVKAITRGKTRIEYNVNSTTTIRKITNIDDLIFNYKRQLIRYKKIGAVPMNRGV